LITYTVVPSKGESGERDHSTGVRLVVDGYLAQLNCRSISYFGLTKRQAITALVNGVAQLVKDGHLDPYSEEDTADRNRDVHCSQCGRA
jgi:hypothetical protein